MGATYQITVHKPNGAKLAELAGLDTSYETLAAARSVSSVGALSLALVHRPGKLGYGYFDYPSDTRIAVYRKPTGGAWRLLGDTIWFVRKTDLVLAEDGTEQILITAYDANHLLTRRIIAYDAGSSEADKTAEADAMMKAIMRENYGSLATDTDRDISSLSIDADLAAGTTPSISKSFSRRAVLATLQEIAQASFVEDGTYIAFDVIAANPDQLAYRNFIGQRGQDRRWPDGISPIILSPDRGNLTNVQRVDDYSTEATFIYAGGQGEGTSRLVATASDPIRLNQSPFGRIEAWKDARNTETAAALQDEADSFLRSRRPKQTFSAKVLDTNSSTFDLHYRFGDFVTADFGGVRMDCRLDAFKVSVSSSGEAIDINLRAETGGDEA